jgi:HemK-like putative methylase
MFFSYFTVTKPRVYAGTQPFGSLELNVRTPVLIPRPETEALAVFLAARVVPRGPRFRLLDLFTGSGCIPLLLLDTWGRNPGIKTQCSAIGVDVSSAAVDLAQENAFKTGLDNRLQLIQADLKQNISLPGRFNLLTANPPYITPKQYESLPASVKDWEDKAALQGEGSDGLGWYRRLAALMGDWLVPGGTLALEVGKNQARPVKQMLKEAGFWGTKIWSDPWQIERAVIAQAPGG